MNKYDISCLSVAYDEYKLEGMKTTDKISH